MKRKNKTMTGNLLGLLIVFLGLVLFLGELMHNVRDLSYSVFDSPSPVVSSSEPESSSSPVPARANYDSAASVSDMPFRLTVLDVGQGLSVLLESNGHYALYDGGGSFSSSFLVSYMQKHGIDSFDYVIASHYDEDHIAGLVGILHTCNVSKLIGPDYEADTKIYRSFLTAAADKNLAPEHPSSGVVFSLGDAEIRVLGPLRSYDSENDLSMPVRIKYGKFSCLITGDAESPAETDLINSGTELSSNLYVAGHHGSSSSNSSAFIRKISPDFTVVSCGIDNEYGHPSKQTLNNLRLSGSGLFRTDEQGSLTFGSDGNVFTSQLPALDWALFS